MHTIEEDEEELLKNNFIKTYLHIHNPMIQDKPYYKLDLSKNILYLHNQLNLSESENDGIFEFDKIFTNEKNNNSDIYKNICPKMIKEFYEGKSFCLISYGNTMSDKFKLLIGDINNKGILFQTFDDIINNNNKEKININFSYFSLYNDKIIDLSLINNVSISLSNNNEFEENFMKNSFEVNKNYDINNLNKMNIANNSDETIDKIDKLFSYLIKIERNSKYHIYTTSHFCFIIYLTDRTNNKIISSLTFILLNGSELLNKNILSRKSEVSSSLKSVESQYIYNSIIYSISANKIFNNKKNNNNNVTNFEKDKLSKLTNILNNFCFNPEKENIKFIIIGNIIPITGYYETTKDTLMFLFNIRNGTINKKNKNKENNLSSKKSKQSRDDLIFDLESKMKYQADNIERLNKIVEKKDEKIFDLEKNYKTQVEFLKNFFGFKGKIEVLLSGDMNTKEYKEAEKIREAKQDANILRKNLKFLEKNIKKKEEEINKLKYEEDIKLNDQTMIRYYLLAEDIKKNKLKDNENKKEFFLQIEKYQNDIKIKDKIISELKKEIEEKNKILLSIPKVIKNKMPLSSDRKEMDNTNNVDTKEIITIKKENKEPEKNDFIEIIKKNKEENDKLKIKYENLLAQSQKQIEDKIEQINQIKEENKLKYKKLQKELKQLFDIFVTLINSYHINKNKNKIFLFEKVLSGVENDINEYNLPNIFKLINKKNFSFSYKTKQEILKDNNKENNESKLTTDKIKDTIVNFVDDIEPVSMKQINDFIKSKNKTIFTFNENQLKQLSQENLIKYYIEITTYIDTLEKNIYRYNESKENNIIKNNNSITISEYEEKINKLKSKLETEYQKNYNNLVVINSQKKLIDDYHFKNILNLSKNKIKEKEKSKHPSLSFPEYCPSIASCQYKENNFLKYRNSSTFRNNTEKNYQINLGSSLHKTNKNNIFKLKTEIFDKNNHENNSRNNSKQRPFSSTSKTNPLNTSNKNNQKHVSFLNINNNISNK